MRKIIPFIVVVAIVAAAIIKFTGRYKPDLAEALEKRISHSGMTVYYDSTYGYYVKYPRFFEQVPDSLVDEPGCTKFRFWNEKEIVLTTYIEPNVAGQSPRQALDSIGRLRHAEKKQCGKDYFIISGMVHEGESEISGYKYHAKYVKHNRLWFVQELVYPEGYDKALKKLLDTVDDWKVWDHSTPEPTWLELYRRHPKRYQPSNH